MKDLPASPRDILRRLLAGIEAGPSAALADLYAPDAVVELPFAGPGGLRLVGRDQIRAHFVRAGAMPLRLHPGQLQVHETANPEVVIAEYEYRGQARTTSAAFTVANVQIVRIRDGLILSSRDFHDHAALAAAVADRPTDRPTAASVEAWVRAYVGAWQSNQPSAIGALFERDACYYTAPFREPWRGREAVVSGWLDRRDSPGDHQFTFAVIGVDGQTAWVRGRTVYPQHVPSAYSNLWVIRFGASGAAVEFTE